MPQENNFAIWRPENSIAKDVVLLIVAGFSLGIAVAIVAGLLTLVTTSAANADELQPATVEEA